MWRSWVRGCAGSSSPPHDPRIHVIARLRGWVKLAGFVMVTLPTCLILVLSVPLLDLMRLPSGRWSETILRAWARCSAWTLGMRVRVEGTPPKRPFLLVANHLSYVDVLVLGSQLGCVFVARGDVGSWPFIGRMCRAGGTIFVRRDSKRDLARVISQMEEALNRDRSVVLFPEGTSSAGDQVLPFRPSLLEVAAGSRPVWYASLSYETPKSAAPAGTAVCWWGDMTFVDHLIRLFALPGFEARLRFGQEAIQAGDRKELAAKLHQAVSGQFRPTSDRVPAALDSGRLADCSSGT